MAVTTATATATIATAVAMEQDTTTARYNTTDTSPHTTAPHKATQYS
jgi:hypothetical protein